jgi:Zn-dependent peptidase ImmA (M78 family)
MDWKRRRQIGDLAGRVQQALRLGGPPYDVRMAVARLQGEIVPPSDFFTEASVRKKGDSFVIEAAVAASDERERFSIAHELGHLFLHMGYLVDPATWNRIDKYRDSPMYRQGHSDEEYEANEFAAAFLMPEAEFRRVAEANRVGSAYNTLEIAKAFEVSVPAAQNRGKWLGMFAWSQ